MSGVLMGIGLAAGPRQGSAARSRTACLHLSASKYNLLGLELACMILLPAL